MFELHATRGPSATYQASVRCPSSSLIMVLCWPTVACFFGINPAACQLVRWKQASSVFVSKNVHISNAEPGTHVVYALQVTCTCLTKGMLTHTAKPTAVLQRTQRLIQVRFWHTAKPNSCVWKNYPANLNGMLTHTVKPNSCVTKNSAANLNGMLTHTHIKA